MNKKSLLFLVWLFCTISLNGVQNFEQVKEDYLQDYALVKSRYGRMIRYAFARVDYLQNYKSDFSYYLSSDDIQKLFHIDLQKNEVLHKARSIITAQLYGIYFQQLINHTYKLLHRVVQAKQYWNYEFIKEQGALYQKLPTYWLHLSSMQAAIKKRIELLTILEKKIAHILGIAFSGVHKIKKIQSADDIEIVLQNVIDPLYEKFKHGCRDKDVLEGHYHNLASLHANMHTLKNKVNKILFKHDVPHHIMRNGYFYGVLAITGFVAMIWYQLNKDKACEYVQRAPKATQEFMHEYIVGPLVGLKKAFWNYDEVENVLTVPQNFSDCKWWMSSDVVMYLLRDYLNQLNTKISYVLRRQQINYYLSSIVPVVGIMYFTSRSVSSMYNHESYYNPMRLIMRDIDVVLTKMSASEQVSFADAGYLYYLASQLKLYVACLTREELIAMRQDIKELLSLEYTCAQKQKVLERMYRTYHFLK